MLAIIQILSLAATAAATLAAHKDKRHEDRGHKRTNDTLGQKLHPQSHPVLEKLNVQGKTKKVPQKIAKMTNTEEFMTNSLMGQGQETHRTSVKETEWTKKQKRKDKYLVTTYFIS